MRSMSGMIGALALGAVTLTPAAARVERIEIVSREPFAAGAEFEKATVVAVIIVALVVGAALVARGLGGQVGVRE